MTHPTTDPTSDRAAFDDGRSLPAPTTPTTPRHAREGEPTPTLRIPTYYASGETHTYAVCVLVPDWVVSGPSGAQPTTGDTTPCAVGLTYGEPEGIERTRCDCCGDGYAAAMDEQGTLYCHACLIPGHDTYGVVQTRFLDLIPFD